MFAGLDLAIDFFDHEMNDAITDAGVLSGAPAEKDGTTEADFIGSRMDTRNVDIELVDKIFVAVNQADQLANVIVETVFGIFSEDVWGGFGGTEADFALGFAEGGNVLAELTRVGRWRRREISVLDRGVGAAGILGHSLDTFGVEAVEIVNFFLDETTLFFEEMMGANKDSFDFAEVGMAEEHELWRIEHGRKVGNGEKIIREDGGEIEKLRVSIGGKMVWKKLGSHRQFLSCNFLNLKVLLEIVYASIPVKYTTILS